MCDIINKKRLFIILIVVFSIFIGNKKTSSIALADNSSEIVIESSTNRVLYEQNARSKKYMASTTKILTALVTILNANMSDIITVNNETIGVEGSSIYLEAGEKLSVKDLLYGLMLRSGNDCAETLAVYCSGSIENFAKLMNETARNCGATNSNFINPHGLHDDNHYTTAKDLALITSVAMKNQQFREIVSTKSVKIPFTTRDTYRYLVNKNKMLKDFEGSTGVKTGYTKKAGRCLVSSCVRNGMELICVVLNCPQMFERSQALLSDSYAKYQNTLLIDSDNIVGFSSYQGHEYSLCVKNDVILPLTQNEQKSVKIKYNYPKNLTCMPNNENEIGYAEIYCENNLIFKEKIYTIVDI
jgi:D-alanyl-D-alanine carboxypeptidase (penicillin-binding protein 5/6)